MTFPQAPDYMFLINPSETLVIHDSSCNGFFCQIADDKYHL
ncbi:hypothetical protein J32TS6_16990 [Virgibacillus pantothenticus]|nr:hypothetical protein J32TS6_16990 [Virgibacillus pantothenticus]